MCCCYATGCCCGCTSLKTGVIIWAIIDAILMAGFGLCNFLFRNPGGGGWCLLMLIMDVLLAIGGSADNTCLMVLWLVFEMIQIVFLFCLWLFLPLALIVWGVASAAWDSADAYCNGEYDDNGLSYNFNGHGISYNYTYSYGNNDHYSGCEYWDEGSNWVDRHLPLFIAIMVTIVVLPIIYIYFWVVVNSLRHKVECDRVQPMIMQPTAFVMAQPQPMMVAQPQPMMQVNPQPMLMQEPPNYYANMPVTPMIQAPPYPPKY